jgi:acyl-coenzyme A synthetase/AMP-(fatty) acid ligase
MNLQDLIHTGSPDFSFPEPVSQTDLLNIQYTSGTTGLPKGCMQEQLYWLTMGVVTCGIAHDIKSMLADHPFFYMDPQWMVVFALMTGSCVFMAKRMSSRQFMGWAREFKFEFSYFPKPLLKTPACEDDQHHHIKRFTAGAMSWQAIHEAEQRFGIPIQKNYGMTEIGAGLIVPDSVTDPKLRGSCGLPAPFREFRIVNEEGKQVADGTTGELLVRGNGIFRGYYHKPEANNQSFSDGWFCTGDLFFRDKQGFYHIVGRKKDMIRRSNENISAVEVEYVVLEMPEIVQAAVVPVPDDYRGEEVKLYVRLKEGLTAEKVPPDTILTHCRSRLAAFKVPRFLEYVTSFPLTASQKIAKQKLLSEKKDLCADCYDAQSSLKL